MKHSAQSTTDTKQKFTLGEAAQILAEDQYTRFGLTPHILDLFQTAHNAGQATVRDQLEEIRADLTENIKREAGSEVFNKVAQTLCHTQSIEQTPIAKDLDEQLIDNINMLVKLDKVLDQFKEEEPAQHVHALD